MNNNLCVLPWIHFYVGPDGDALPCCNARQDLPITNIKSVNSIADIVNHPSLIRIRSNMLNDSHSPECDYCLDHEAVGLDSYRTRNNKLFNLSSAEPTTEYIDHFHLKLHDIRTNNICNLKCRMCSGYSSSRIAAEEKAIWNNRINEKQINSDDINRIYQLLEPELQTVEKFYFAGGEPLLMPEHYKLLKTLIDSSICDVPIEYSTNLTSLHYKDKYIVDLWKHFSNIKVGCSIDATGPRATYQRHGTVWKDIKNNIRCIQEEAPNVKIIITSVLTVFNSLHLQDVQRELIDNLKINPEHIISSIASAPDFLSISILPNGLKNEFILKSTAHIEYLRTVKDTQNLCKWWSDAVQYVQDNDNSHLILKFMEHNKTLDNHRNESFVTVYPELAELFNT